MENKKYVINPDKVLFTQLGEEAVLYDIDRNSYVSMNETFCQIFLGIQNGLGTDEILSKLLEEFDVEMDVCKGELREAISGLLDKGFIDEVA